VIVPSTVIRPILLPRFSPNQRFPSTPTLISSALEDAVGIANSVKPLPSVAIRPILFAITSVNHMLPSGPAMIPLAPAPTTNSVTVPSSVARATFPCPPSVNQMLPSGPAVMSVKPALAVMPLENSVIAPVVGISLAILLPPFSANQMLLSGPVVMPVGKLPAVGISNSVIVPSAAISPILLPAVSVNHTFLTLLASAGPDVVMLGNALGVGTSNSTIVPAGSALAGNATRRGANSPIAAPSAPNRRPCRISPTPRIGLPPLPIVRFNDRQVAREP
jgi:hypothetical protein